MRPSVFLGMLISLVLAVGALAIVLCSTIVIVHSRNDPWAAAAALFSVLFAITSVLKFGIAVQIVRSNALQLDDWELNELTKAEYNGQALSVVVSIFLFIISLALYII